MGITGHYVLSLGGGSGRLQFLDAEDPAHSNWTRFINHSSKAPNVDVEIDASGLSEQRRCPVARVVVIQPVPEGAELRFDYGDFFFEKAGRGAAVD